MAKKITGVALQLGNRKWRFNEEAGAPMATEQRATLVIGDERVLTLSEVVAKDEDLKWALNWINNEAKHLRERGEPQEALEVALDMILERHGIVLDPA